MSNKLQGAGDPEDEVPNAFDAYRRAHPDPLHRVAGDVAPGFVVTTNAYERAADLVENFLGSDDDEHRD